MIRVDLQLPVEVSVKAQRGRRGANLLDVVQDPAVIGVFLVAVMTFLFALTLNHRADSRHEALSASVQSAVRDSARFEEDLRTADQLRAKRNRIQERIAAVGRIDQNRFAFVHVLDQVASALVADVWIEQVVTNSMDQSGTVRFTVNGFAPNNETVNLYLAQLEQSPFVTGVALQGANGVTMNGQEVTRFVLTGMSEVPDDSFLLTETIRPDGTRTSDIEQGELIIEAPAVDSTGASQADTAAATATPTQTPPALPDGAGTNR